MKYTIEGFDQERMVALGLDAIDAVILRWFIDFENTHRMKTVIHEDVPYQWVKYEAVMADLPILGINNNDSLARRFNKLVDAEVLKKYVKRREGTYTCFARGEAYLSLVSKLPTQKSEADDSKVGRAPDSKVGPKDSSPKSYSSTKNKESPISAPDKNTEYLPLAEELAAAVKQTMPRQRCNPKGWTRDIRLLIKTDGATKEEVRRVIAWLPSAGRICSLIVC